ncbi:MAG: hypothetical protein R3247_01760 [Rhodothermales bacterium]|nr:hypothetical protein [Rhodothermales bacterium]
MDRTAEIRWFFDGAVPEAAADWFGALGPPPEPEAPRTDHYLLPTGPALNVKLREGHAEAKRRDGDGRTVRLHGGAEGVLEHWRKWSFPLAEAATVPDDACWLAVPKSRRMRRYRLDADGTLQEITGTDAAPERVCEVEVSRIGVAGRSFWSLCFEASGPDPAATLRRAATHVFAQAPPLRLPADASMGYPAFLAKVWGSKA